MIDIEDIMSSLILSDGLDIYEALESVHKIIISSDSFSDCWLINIIDYDDITRTAEVVQDYEVIDIKRWFIAQGVEREIIKVKK